MQWQQHYQVAYALQSWKHRPNGDDSVAAQWQQDLTTMAIASWQCLICKMTIIHGNGNGSSQQSHAANITITVIPLCSNRVLPQWWQAVTTMATANSQHEIFLLKKSTNGHG